MFKGIYFKMFLIYNVLLNKTTWFLKTLAKWSYWVYYNYKRKASRSVKFIEQLLFKHFFIICNEDESRGNFCYLTIILALFVEKWTNLFQK